MAENSKIAWTDHTVNLWHGCYEVHAGCDNCYAKQLANRYHGPHLLWEQSGPRMYIKSAFPDLNKYQRQAEKTGIRYKVFMNSMSDLFEKSMPLVNFKHESMLSSLYSTTGHLRELFFELVDDCPNLDFILLTKRPSNIMKMIPPKWLTNPPANVIYMTSVVDQDTADTLIPQLLDVPGRHGLSMEPLIGRVDICASVRLYMFKKFGSFHTTFFGDKLEWVIVGGESGHNSRSMNMQWVRRIKEQCAVSEIAFFFKQDSQLDNKDLHNIETFPEDLRIRQFPNFMNY